MTGLGAVAAAVPVFGQPQDLATLTLKQASDLIRRRTVSAVELTSACMKRIDAYNPRTGALLWYTGTTNRFPIPVPIFTE